MYVKGELHENRDRKADSFSRPLWVFLHVSWDAELFSFIVNL